MHAFDMLILLEILNSTFYNDNIIYIFQVVSVMGLLVNLIGIVAFRNSHTHGHSHGSHGHSHGGQHSEPSHHNTNMEGN